MLTWEEKVGILLTFLIILLNEDMELPLLPNNTGTLLLLATAMNHIDLPRFRSANLNRDRVSGAERLFNDYFSPNPVFPLSYFRRRFRLTRRLFQKIEEALVANNDYFLQKHDAIGVVGLSTKQKMTAAIRMLAYGSSADELDEYIRIGETTVLECLKEFCLTIIRVFGPEFLRKPNAVDTQRILRHSAARGFPCMLGSIDCMHWMWKNCPIGEAGQYLNRKKQKTVILEAVATYDLWIWHAFFGEPGSNNDLNVLDHSPIFNDYLRGISPTATFRINNRLFNQPYYLADGIYPPWAMFVQTISEPHTPERKHFAMVQEACRKDIERAFGVLQISWAILRNGCRLWHRRALHYVMLACIILHNMKVLDERADILDCFTWTDVEVVDRSNAPVSHTWEERYPQYVVSRQTMVNEQAHHVLQDNLVQHIWNLHQQT